jgi:hypothetical protein
MRIWHGVLLALLLAASAAEAISGLDFPGTGADGNTIRFEFAAASGTAPMPAYPATYIWRAFPRYQDSFYAALFHARNDGGPFVNGLQYYGFHPYPTGWPGAGSRIVWEIAACDGDTTGPAVVFSRWYTQVAIVFQSGGTRFHTFYWDWPDTSKVITNSCPSAPAPTPPAIMVGDAAWNQGDGGSGVGYEVYHGILRGFQFYDTNLSLAQITQELSSPGSVRRPWYLNLNPTPADISDKSGQGHHPAWVGPKRPALWQEADSPPSAPTNLRVTMP